MEGWKYALNMNKNRPVAFVLTRQDVPVINRETYAPVEGFRKGAYTIADAPQADPEIILVATGSEVHLALDAYEKLLADGVKARVVSMPSWELFEEQSDEYRESVLPSGVTRRMAIEAGATHGWERYIGRCGKVVGLDRFGASAPGGTNLKNFGFTVENILDNARELFS
jgi:transketolase